MKNPGSSGLNSGYYDQGEGSNDYSSTSEDEFSRSIEKEEQDEDMVMADLPGPQPMEEVEPQIPARWKTVEVVASFDPYEMQAGGGFVLRDCRGYAALVEAFPVSGNCPLTIEAIVLRNAMQKMISFGEHRVVFIIDSNCLYNILMGMVPPKILKSFGPMIRSMIRDCKNYQWAYEFLFLRRRRTKLAAAEWLADCGMRCQQHYRWDIHRPWPPQLVALVLGSTVLR